MRHRPRTVRAMFFGNNAGGIDWPNMQCSANITTPVDTTETVPYPRTYCSTGAIEIDSVALGDGIVVVNGAWRLT